MSNDIVTTTVFNAASEVETDKVSPGRDRFDASLQLMTFY